MAYGKIKADAFIYDDGGSDTEITAATIASNSSKADTASPTFTGTVTLPGTVQVGGQATDVTIAGSNANALEIKQGSTTYLKFDTNEQNVQLSKPMVSSSDITINGQQELRLADSDSSNFIAFKAPDPVSTNSTWTFPSDAPVAGNVLKVSSVSNNNPTLEWGGGGKVLQSLYQISTTALSSSHSASNYNFSVSNGTQVCAVNFTRQSATSIVHIWAHINGKISGNGFAVDGIFCGSDGIAAAIRNGYGSDGGGSAIYGSIASSDIGSSQVVIQSRLGGTRGGNTRYTRTDYSLNFYNSLLVLEIEP